MFAADDADLNRVVEELRLDHVVVDPLRGGPEPTRAHQRLVAQVQKVKAETGVDVYVALVQDVGGSDSIEAPDAYAARLRKALGNASGVYIVGGAGTIVQENAWGTPFSGTDISLLSSAAAYEINAQWRSRMGEETGGAGDVVTVEAAVRSVPGAITWDASENRSASEYGYQTVLSAADVDDLVDWGVETSTKSEWRPMYGADDDAVEAQARNWLWAVPTFLVLFLGLFAVLRRWPAKLAARGSAPELADMRAAAQRELDTLSTALTQVANAAARVDEERWTRALVAQDLASTAADSDDVAEVVGALTLARTGARDAQIARTGRGTGYRGCFFDPRHGEAVGERVWKVGQGDVELPACQQCLDAGRRRAAPDSLLLPGRAGRLRPYYEGRSVWARTGYGALTNSYAADVVRSRS